VGQKPLYIYQAVGRLHFASEVKAFPAEARLNAHLPGSVAAVETFIGARTPYPDVERVGPGTCIRVDHRTGRRTAWIYWSIEAIAQEGGEAPNTADVWVDQYAGAVARSAEEQRPLGLDHALLLSGGLDSAVLAYTMRPPVCVTVRYPGEPVPDESPRARRIAQDIGAEIVVVEPSVADFRDTAEEIVDALDYPVGNASFLSEFTAYRAVSARGLRVVTAGIGPDEYLLGYVRHLMALNDPDAVLAAGNAAYQPLADRIRRLGPVSAADRYLALILRGSDDPSVLSLVRGVFSSGLRTDQALTVVDHHLSLPALLATSDKLASKFSLERRSPYLAQKVVEISVQAPKPIRVAPLNRSKALLREAAVRLGVPEWATRPDGKVGFASPVPSWLQGPLSVWCEERIRAALDGPIAPSVAEFVARGLNQSGTAHDRSRMMALMWALWAAKESECKGARVGGG
jgi:asparagine synthase (glutamine-hydrolysing)